MNGHKRLIVHTSVRVVDILLIVPLILLDYDVLVIEPLVYHFIRLAVVIWLLSVALLEYNHEILTIIRIIVAPNLKRLINTFHFAFEVGEPGHFLM